MIQVFQRYRPMSGAVPSPVVEYETRAGLMRWTPATSGRKLTSFDVAALIGSAVETRPADISTALIMTRWRQLPICKPLALRC